ncbi:hypothetical protein [Fusobacterium animalis]|uniref:hypothetical protein n=1 Tax=Fusobacterium animalis TaxID=76859 RepID=UPI0030D4C144
MLFLRKLILGIFFTYTIVYIAEYIHLNKVLHFLDYYYLLTLIFCIYIFIISGIYSIKKPISYFLIISIVLLFIKKINISIYIEFFIEKSTCPLQILFLLNLILNFINAILYDKILKKNAISDKKIFPEREEDIKYILNFIENKDNKNITTLGIDSKFGTGKTFIVEKILERLNTEEYEQIKVRCLFLEKEEVYYYIIEKIKKVLSKNLIFISNLKKFHKSILKIFDNKFLGGLNELLSDSSKTDEIDNLKDIIRKLKKTIVIVFDDIDRTQDIEKIEKILSFISDFSIKNVKILVLFSLDNLKKIDKRFTRDYIEKYIPLDREITKISFVNLLKSEIGERKLNEEDFKFLYIFEQKDFMIYPDDEEKQRKEFKFVRNIYSLLGIYDISIKEKEITPRQVENFMEEVIELLKYENFNINIEKRILITYVFLKHIFYKEFYETLANSETSFFELFPIEIKFQDGIILTLDELDLIQNLINKKANILIDEKRRDILINDDIVFYFKRSDNSDGYEYTLDNYLKKLKISKNNNLKANFNNLEKEYLSLKIENLSRITKINILIYSLFNIFLYSYEEKEYKVTERKDRIEKGIKKLKYLGSKEEVSEYQKFYKDFSPEISNQNLFSEFYEKFSNKKEKYKIFYRLEFPTVVAMKVLITLGTEDEQREFLNVILKINKGKIRENYLKAFFLTNLDEVDIKISDNIIDLILKKQYEIEDEKFIILICNNLKRILKRMHYIPKFYSETPQEYLEKIEEYLERYENSMRDFLVSFEKGKVILEKYISFVKLLKEILISKDYDRKKRNEKNMDKEESLIEKEIKNSKTKEDKIKKIETFLDEGKINFEEYKYFYCYIESDSI